MSSGTLIPWVKPQFFDSNGDPLADGSLEFYDAGTTNLRDTFSDVSLSTANTNPLTLDSAGRPQSGAIFLTPGASYKVIAKNSLGVTQWTQDDVSAIPVASTAFDITGVAGEPLTAGQIAYLSDGSGGLNAGRWYKADADAAYSSINPPEVAFVVADLDTGDSGSFRKGGELTGLAGLTSGATYYVSGTAGSITATAPINARIVGQATSTSTLMVNTGVYAPVTVDNGIVEGRLTLTTGVPVTTSDVTAAGTLYFTPYRGNRIALYDGTGWNVRTFSERSLVLTLTSGKNYDVFAYDSAGTVTLELSQAWTSDTTRADALALQDGILSKGSALMRRYLGTIRASGANTTEDSKTKRFVWNMYNRKRGQLLVGEATDSWTYNTAAWRQANNSAANQVELVAGQAEDVVTLTVAVTQRNTSGNPVAVGIGEDSTTAHDPSFLHAGAGSDAANGVVVIATGSKVPAIGYHKYCWLEMGNGVTTTWYGDAGGAAYQSGMAGTWER